MAEAGAGGGEYGTDMWTEAMFPTTMRGRETRGTGAGRGGGGLASRKRRSRRERELNNLACKDCTARYVILGAIVDLFALVENLESRILYDCCCSTVVVLV